MNRAEQTTTDENDGVSAKPKTGGAVLRCFMAFPGSECRFTAHALLQKLSLRVNHNWQLLTCLPSLLSWLPMEGRLIENKGKAEPEWAREIMELRRLLGLSQAALGQRLQYSPVAVSRWERGTKEPTAEAYIRLGHLAEGPASWSFWSRAGLRAADIARKLPKTARLSKSRLPEFEIVLAGGGKKTEQRATKLKIVAIPVLPVRAATLGESGDRFTDLGQLTAEAVIAAPVTWNPNAGTTSCLRVKGSSMPPAMNDGDLVAVDASLNDPEKLNGKIIVASHRKHGLLLGRFRKVDGMQLLESENREYAPLVLRRAAIAEYSAKCFGCFARRLKRASAPPPENERLSH